MSHFFQSFFAGVLNFLIQMLPKPWAYGLARMVGNTIFVLSSKRRQIARANIEQALGNRFPAERKRKIARQAFQHVALGITDLFLIEKTKETAEQHFHFQGLEHYHAALERKKGIILVTSHLGSWEYLSFLFYLTQTKCSVIVKTLRNRFLNQKINNARRVIGLNPMAGKNSIRDLLKELHHNHTVAVLIDQWAGPEGVWQKFFNEWTSTTSLSVRLALKTNSALLPAYCLRRADGDYDIKIRPAILVENYENAPEAEITALLNQQLEEMILQYPEQWVWTHRRWKPKPSQTRTPS